MAEIAGLILGVIGISGLFSACMESFDVVVSGKNFSDDYEQLCALFSLQRARFGLWGESVGLIPNPDGQRLQYDKNLDRPDIKDGVERILNNIKSILSEASEVDNRYRSETEGPPGSELSTSRDTSPWKVTRWALHDGKKFEDLVNRLEKVVDGLESITKSLGLIAEQHARLQEEIETISDIRSLKLLRDASSSHRSMLNDDSGSSSRLFTREVAEFVLEQKTIASGPPTGPITLNSFFTAPTRRSTLIDSLKSDAVVIPGAWPRSLKSSLEENKKAEPKRKDPDFQDFRDRPPVSRALNSLRDAYIRARKAGGIVPGLEVGGTYDKVSLRNSKSVNPKIQSEDLPQNQRLIRELLEKSNKPTPLSFAAGDAEYGKKLATIKKEDESTWHGHDANLVVKAHSGSSAAKRMFLELRNIRLSKVPFISAAPLEDSLDKVLAGIEGPPETPYEGGVFFITVRLSQDSLKAPLMRFQTKIYHPNISSQGRICTDYDQKWNSKVSRINPNKDPSSLWYHEKTGEALWSLGALLTALCGLLAAPDIHDPLVPEIAQKYIEDYDDYCRSAKAYTQRYALARRPDDNELIFLEDSQEVSNETAHYEPPSLSTKLGAQSLASFEPSVLHSSFTESRSQEISSTAPLESVFNEAYPKKIYHTKSSGEGAIPSTRFNLWPTQDSKDPLCSKPQFGEDQAKEWAKNFEKFRQRYNTLITQEEKGGPALMGAVLVHLKKR